FQKTRVKNWCFSCSPVLTVSYIFLIIKRSHIHAPRSVSAGRGMSFAYTGFAALNQRRDRVEVFKTPLPRGACVARAAPGARAFRARARRRDSLAGTGRLRAARAPPPRGSRPIRPRWKG